MSRPVLFLDVDGVLNHLAFFKERHAKGRVDRHPICPQAMAILNRIVEATDCRVTVSSTWRTDSRCREVLRRHGFKGCFSAEWRTPWIRRTNDDIRGDEIADWLSRNPAPRYAIVDDESDMREEQRPFFVQTSFETGLTDEHADRLIALLAPSPGQREAGR